jgi:hypothetical protein
MDWIQVAIRNPPSENVGSPAGETTGVLHTYTYIYTHMCVYTCEWVYVCKTCEYIKPNIVVGKDWIRIRNRV